MGTNNLIHFEFLIFVIDFYFLPINSLRNYINVTLVVDNFVLIISTPNSSLIFQFYLEFIFQMWV